MKSLQELSKDELLNFIYNLEPGTINIFEPIAGCVVCSPKDSKIEYGYECDRCSQENEEWHKALEKSRIESK